MTQTVQYVVDLKGAQEAQRELDRLNVAFDKNNSAAMAMDKSIAQMERDIKDLNAAIAAGGPNVVQYKRALKDLQTQAAQGAAGTRNMGQAALEASRGLEDLQYGIGGVVNNIPSLTMAFGASAGLTAAISLGAVAIAQIVKHSGSMIDEFGRAERESKALTMEIRRLAMVASDSLAKSFNMTKTSVEDAATALRNFGKDSKQVAEDDLLREISRNSFRLERQKQIEADRKSGIDGLKAEAKAMEEHAASRVRTDAKGRKVGIFGQERYNEIQEQIRLESELLKLNTNKVTETNKVIASQMAEASSLAEINAELRVREDFKKAEDEAKKGGKGAAVNAEAEVRALIAAQEQQDEMIGKLEYEHDKVLKDAANDRWEKALKDEAAQRKRQENERMRDQKSADRARERENKKTLDAIAKAERKHAEEQAQYATQAVSIVAGASTQLVSDMISGQEQALERFGLSIMAQAGQALVSYGVQAIGRGVLEASNPITAPLAPASFAAGGALVVAGVGLGGVAGGVGSLMGNAGSGSDDKRSRRDPGASPRRGGGGGDGGPVVLNLTYGAAGPLPEDTARLISRELRTGAKRAGR